MTQHTATVNTAYTSLEEDLRLIVGVGVDGEEIPDLVIPTTRLELRRMRSNARHEPDWFFGRYRHGRVWGFWYQDPVLNVIWWVPAMS